MRRLLARTALVLGGLLLLVAIAVLALGVLANTGRGRAFIAATVERLSDGRVVLVGLGGSFPAHLTLDRLVLRDKQGTWLEAEQIALDWSPLELIRRRIIALDRLRVATLDIERAPVSQAPPGPPPSIPHIELADGAIGSLKLGAALVGTPAVLTVRGSARLRSLEDASAQLHVQRAGAPGDYALDLRFDRARLEATLIAHEPASGPLEHLLGLPGLGALNAQVRLTGPRSAEQLDAEVSAGDLELRASGRLDLTQRAMDVDVALDAPALAPRPDLAWQRLALAAHVRGALDAPQGEGHLEVAGLKLAQGAVGEIEARFAARDRALELHAQARRLELPGAASSLLAATPLEIDARLALAQKDRPLEVRLSHRLFALEAHATTTERPAATFSLQLPDLEPLARLASQELRGTAVLTGRLEQRATGTFGLTLEGDARRLETPAAWRTLLTPNVALDAAASLSGERFTLERLRLRTPALRASLTGAAQRTARPATGASLIESLQARFALDLVDLARVSPELAGDAHAEGRVEGPWRDLSASAGVRARLSIRGSPPGVLAATLGAHGLPGRPQAMLAARGVIDDAPLGLDATLEPAHRGFHARVRHADWKSAHLRGEITIDPQTESADRGEMDLSIGSLADFDRVLGTSLEGSIGGQLKFTSAAGRPEAHVELDGQGLRVGSLVGDLRLAGAGPANAVALRLALTTPNLAGTPGKLDAAALLNLDAGVVRVDSATGHYRNVEIRLLAPAPIDFASGLALEHLELGAEGARLTAHGRVLPTLDFQATLERVEPKLVNRLVPDLLAAGTLGGGLHLAGRWSAPEGEVRLDATGLKLAGDEAIGLPAFDAHARADLNGRAAHLDAHLTAHGASLLAVTGQVPLTASGSYDVKAQGEFDLGLIKALLEARGVHAAGQLSINASLAGTPQAPEIGGTLALAHGSLRDYARGVNLTNISAEVSGDQSKLVIRHFGATAAPGSVSVTGSLSPLEHGVPLALTVTATHAQPIASNLLTVTLDSKLDISGKLLERIDAKGTMKIERALIGIPDSLPPNVAVLDVRRRGRGQQAPAAPEHALVYAFDVAIDAPNQVLVQGRGLDAELGGRLHIGGTTDAPRVTGHLDLQRGSFVIAGSTLTLSEGRVSFDDAGLKNRIDPTIRFVAQRTVSNVGTPVVAKLEISGYADAPRFTFSTTPDQQMPSDQILALLLFDQPPSQLSALQLAQIGASLATLTGVGAGPNPLVKLQRTLGLSQLTVGSGTTTTATGATQSTGAAIAAGRYIGRRVYLEARQTTTGQSQVQVNVDLSQHLKLQTRLGNGSSVVQGTTPENDPGSSIGLSYQFDY